MSPGTAARDAAGGNLAAQLETWRLRVERELDRWLPAETVVPPP